MSEVRPRNWMHPVIEVERALRRRRATIGAGLAMVLWGLWIWWEARQSGRPVLMSGFGWMAGAFAGVMTARWWAARRALDLRAVARRVEARFPELDGRLLAAIEPVSDRQDRLSAYLRDRLEGEVQAHLRRNPWQESYRDRERKWLGTGEAGLALALLAVTVLLASVNAPRKGVAGREDGALHPETVQVFPGNTEVERGTRLVVEARFDTADAREVALEWLDETGGQVQARFEMRRSLEDPVYGAVVPRVDQAGRYRVVHGSPGGGGAPGQSETYAVEVFFFPELERADVTVRPPDYTGQPVKVLQDVRTVSALEGSELGFRLQVNKALAEAELYGEDGAIVPLEPAKGKETELVAEMKPEKTQRYRVHLVDAEGRANKEPPWIQVQLKENQRPKFELTFPGKDVEVSALQELAVSGRVWDDLGVERLGVAVTVGEKSKEMVLRDQPLPGRAKQEWSTLFPLEELGAEPAQLVSYHVWAEDKGPGGELRRTESDLFLAEVRDWEHRFREAPPSGGEPGEGNESQQLRLRQKEIINATWTLTQRTARTGVAAVKEDVGVVRGSQEIVMENTARLMEEMPDAELHRWLSQAREKMEQAAGFLQRVEEKHEAGLWKEALQAERLAYQNLLQAEGRETQVTRSNAPKSQSASEQGAERRMMDLELKQQEDRYEKESQAQSEAQAKGEQEANLDILRRLRELARRQEAVADRLRELEAKLEEVKEPREKEDLERQLKRLREEQEELLRDVDQLGERMDGQENPERLQEERQRLEGAREEVRQANEAIQRGELAEAATAASRAQREMKELEEDFRERTASRFAEEMRQMRETARELARQEEEIGGKLENAPDAKNPFERNEAAGARREMLDQLGEQRRRVDGLLETMRQVSEQAETPEPALSNALYEAVRRARTEGVDEALDEALTEVRFGALDRAVEPERAAARAMDQLQTDVEKAAESVLGSEREGLRKARAELDRLIGSVEEEAKANGEVAAKDGGKKSAGNPQQAKPEPDGEVLFFDQQEAAAPAQGPLMGDNFSGWADGMRRLEDLLETPASRSEVSRVLDRAREFRMEYRRHDAPPQWDLVQMGVVRPLSELRDRVAQELARLEGKEPLAPIDRDPVPGPYRELVRRYYEKLARGE